MWFLGQSLGTVRLTSSATAGPSSSASQAGGSPAGSQRLSETVPVARCSASAGRRRWTYAMPAPIDRSPVSWTSTLLLKTATATPGSSSSSGTTPDWMMVASSACETACAKREGARGTFDVWYQDGAAGSLV